MDFCVAIALKSKIKIEQTCLINELVKLGLPVASLIPNSLPVQNSEYFFEVSISCCSCSSFRCLCTMYLSFRRFVRQLIHMRERLNAHKTGYIDDVLTLDNATFGHYASIPLNLKSKIVQKRKCLLTYK